jgi:ABC-type uncharacterized transport system auxiliary subunit
MVRYNISRLLSLGVFLTIWLSGCSSVPLTNFYMFAPDLSQKPEPATVPIPATLAIDVFKADSVYQQDRILFHASPYEVNFYETRRWLRLPEDMITGQILKLIASAGLFQRVHGRPGDLAADYILQGRIRMLDHWYLNDSASSVRVKLDYELRTPEKDGIVWADTFDTSVTIPKLQFSTETMQGFETALLENVQMALTGMTKALAQRK